VDAISDLPVPSDTAAGCSPPYVKLGRIHRSKIVSGQYQHGAGLPSAGLAREHEVSVTVTCHALAMLAANRYVNRPGKFASYRMTWQAIA
jgi:DNA-binding transcriptional regulator YhcF (GntR family)